MVSVCTGTPHIPVVWRHIAALLMVFVCAGRANETSSCALCDSEPTFYDGMYLGFMGLLSLLMHWICIDRHARSAR